MRLEVFLEQCFNENGDADVVEGDRAGTVFLWDGAGDSDCVVHFDADIDVVLISESTVRLLFE